MPCGTDMRCGMAGLAVLSVLLGVCAGSVTPILSRVAQSISGLTNTIPAVQATTLTVSAQDQFAAISMPMLALTFGGLLILVAATVYLITRRQKVTRDRTWDCGAPLTSRTEITATGFSRSLMTIFQFLMRPTKHITTTYADNAKYFPTRRHIELGFFDVYDTYIYTPVRRCAEYLSQTAKKIQSGNVNEYILYIGITLAALLIWISF